MVMVMEWNGYNNFYSGPTTQWIKSLKIKANKIHLKGNECVPSLHWLPFKIICRGREGGKEEQRTIKYLGRLRY